MKLIDNNWRVLAVISFAFILLAIVLAVSSPCTGYELSIYTGTPASVWTLLVVAHINGLVLLISALDDERTTKKVSAGYSILLLSNLVLMLLPTLRGYFLYATADAMNHISKVMDILAIGSFRHDTSNLYPVTHTLLSELTIVTSISLMDVARSFMPVMSTLLTAFLYVLSRLVFHRKRVIILSVASSFVFVFNYFQTMIYPELISLYLVSLILYLYLRSQSQGGRVFRFLLIFYLIYCVFLYPPTVYVIAFALLITDMVRCFRKPTNRFSSVRDIGLGLFVICVVSVYQWTSGFGAFRALVEHVALTLRGLPPHFLARAQATTTGIGILDAIEFFLKMVGDDLVWGVLSLVAIIILVRNRRWVRQPLFLLAVFFLVVGPFYASLFITRSKTISRLLFITPIYTITPLLVGFSFYRFFSRRPTKSTKTLILLIIAATWLISVFGIYHSPYLLQPSLQTTRMDLKGAEWFFKYRNPMLASRLMGLPFSVWNIVLGDKEVLSMELQGSFTLGTNALPEWDGSPSVPEYIGYVTRGRQYFISENVYLINETNPNYLIVTSRYVQASDDPVLSEKGILDRSLYAKNIDISVLRKIRNDPATQIICANGEYDLHYVLVWDNIDDFMRAAATG